MYASVFAVVAGIVMVYAVDPSSGAAASPSYSIIEASRMWERRQQLVASAGTDASNSRDGLEVIAKLVPSAGVPDPGSVQAIGYVMVAQRGWNGAEFDCLVSLWTRESHWNPYAENPSSGAYGIPQALPGDKMASVADDWRTNPSTQITWGLNYIANRYGSPCNAWAHSEETNWY